MDLLELSIQFLFSRAKRYSHTGKKFISHANDIRTAINQMNELNVKSCFFLYRRV